MMGLSNPTLYYDFDCTRKVEKVNDLYNVELGYVSNKVDKVVIELVVKNEGTHNAYDIKIEMTTGDVIYTSVINELEPNKVGRLIIHINKGTALPIEKSVSVVLKYDNI